MARTHVVKKGESTRSIASLHGISTEALLAANPDLPRALHKGTKVFLQLDQGQRLSIPSAVGDVNLGPSSVCKPGTVFVWVTPNEGVCVLDTSKMPPGTPAPQGPCNPGYVPAVRVTNEPTTNGQYTCISANYPGMPRPQQPANSQPQPGAPTPQPQPTVPGWPDPSGLIPQMPGLPAMPGVPQLADIFPALPQSPATFLPTGTGIDDKTGLPLPFTTPGTTPAGVPVMDPRLLQKGAIPSGTISPEGAYGFLPPPSPEPDCKAVWGPAAFSIVRDDGNVYCAICDDEKAVYSKMLGVCLPPGVNLDEVEKLAASGAKFCGVLESQITKGRMSVGFDPKGPAPLCDKVFPGSFPATDTDGCVYCRECDAGETYDAAKNACVKAGAKPETGDKTIAPAAPAGMSAGTKWAIGLGVLLVAGTAYHFATKKKGA